MGLDRRGAESWELEGVNRVLSGLEGELGPQMAELLTADEIAALAARCARLRRRGQPRAPSGQMPAVPGSCSSTCDEERGPMLSAIHEPGHPAWAG